MAFDLLVFDLDGTLIDSELDLALAVNATRANVGLGTVEHQTIASYVGNGALSRRASVAVDMLISLSSSADVRRDGLRARP